MTTTSEDFATDPGDPFTIDDGAGNSVTFDVTAGSYNGGGFLSKHESSNANTVTVNVSGANVGGLVFGIGFHTATPSMGPLGADLSINGGADTASRTDDGFLGLISTDGMTIASVAELASKGHNNGWGDGHVALDDIVIATRPQDFIEFTDRTAFLNAAVALGLTTTNQDFATDPGDSFTIDDGAGNSVTLDVTRGSYHVGEELLFEGESFSSEVSVTGTNVGGSVFGIGFRTETPNAGPLGADLSINDGAYTASRADDGFLGLLSPRGMSIASVVELTSKGNDNGWVTGHVGLDDIVIATEQGSNAVPEPSSFVLLMLGGLLTGGFCCRRRRQESTAEE